MSVQQKTFNFSESYLTAHRRSMYALAATMVLLILFETRSIIFVALVLILIIGQTRYIFGRWRQMTLHFSPDCLVREAGTVRQQVAWDSIAKVCFRQSPQGAPRVIEVFTVDGSPLTLFGYEPMSEVFSLIKDSIPPTAQIKIKREWLNWESPLVVISMILVAALVVEDIGRIGGRAFSENIFALIQIAMGVIILSYGPFSRTDPNFRREEITIGVLVIVSAAIMLIFKVIELTETWS
jgi:hypothetical protein